MTVVVLALACACPFVGRYLITEDTVQPADAIVVLAGTRGSRWLEALHLYQDGTAPAIVLSSDRLEAAEFVLQGRGVSLPRESDLVRDAMIQLGVPPGAVEVFRSSVDNTAQEAAATRQLAVRRHWKRLVIVTSKYHTRRARFAFNRAFRGTGIDIRVRATRYDPITPATWWMHRFDARWVLLEVPKLIAYWLGMEG